MTCKRYRSLRFKFVVFFLVISMVSSFGAGVVHLTINKDDVISFINKEQNLAVQKINLLYEYTDMDPYEIASEVRSSSLDVSVYKDFPSHIIVTNKSIEEIREERITIVDVRFSKINSVIVIPVEDCFLAIKRVGSIKTVVPPILNILQLVFLCIVFATGATFIVSKHALKPIRTLGSAMAEVSKGNFKMQLETHSNDEISKLMNSFNTMVKELDNMETLRDDFVSNVSHEFRTPLSSIKGFAQLLQDESISEEDKQEYLKIIIEESDRLSKLSSNILYLSKLDNQEIPTNNTMFQVDEQIRRCILMLEPEWSKKNLVLEIDLEDVSFYGDMEMLSLVWLNLIGNAIKFSYNNGKIFIALAKQQDTIKLTVKDNGSGISKSALPYVFDKFYQEDISHSTNGNGLGLSLVKSIVKRYDGLINVDSQVGEGCQFIVCLPTGK